MMEEGQTFREFVLTCARAFGGGVHMRDEPLSKLPEPQEVNPFYRTSFELASTRVEELVKLAKDPERRDAYLQAKKRENIDDMKQRQAEKVQQNARLDAMMKMVQAWEPPTPSHVELKKFMIEQLSMSSENLEYYPRAIAEAEAETLEEMFEAELESARRSAAYYEKALVEAIVNTEKDNEWVLALYENLNECEQANE